jgi:glutathionylspermidine synthase
MDGLIAGRQPMAASAQHPAGFNFTVAAASNYPMQRIVCPERDDWQATAESAGFDFHTIDGERYWDERAYYAFTLDEIERQIEEPTGEIDAMCLELVGRAISDENTLRRLKIPEAFWPLISESWERDEASLYGRIDLSFGGRGAAKLLEYNADTPTSIFEDSVFQFNWVFESFLVRLFALV